MAGATKHLTDEILSVVPRMKVLSDYILGLEISVLLIIKKEDDIIKEIRFYLLQKNFLQNYSVII